MLDLIHVPKTRKGKFKEPSTFIIEGGFMAKTKPEHGLKVNLYIHHRAFGSGIVKEVNGDEVKMKFQDGISRKFSGKVLLEKGLIMAIN